MMRREVFKAAPLLALPAIFPADLNAGSGKPLTACARIFRAWSVERDRVNGPEGRAMTEEQFNSAVAEFSKLDDAIREAPAETVEDFVLKVIALTEYGFCGLPNRADLPQLWDEAERLVGVQQ